MSHHTPFSERPQELQDLLRAQRRQLIDRAWLQFQADPNFRELCEHVEHEVEDFASIAGQPHGANMIVTAAAGIDALGSMLVNQAENNPLARIALDVVAQFATALAALIRKHEIAEGVNGPALTAEEQERFAQIAQEFEQMLSGATTEPDEPKAREDDEDWRPGTYL